MEEIKREFKGIWIPVEIWEKPGLSIVERCIWAEIDSFYPRGCWKTNETLAREMGISIATIKRAIVLLQKKQLIKPAGYKDRCRIWKSNVYLQLEFDVAQIEPTERDLAQNEPTTRLNLFNDLAQNEPQTNTMRIKKEYSVDFLNFWEEYPRKKNQIGAFAAWKARKKDKYKPEFIMSCLANYRKQIEGTEERFLLLPSTFLGSNLRFLDYRPVPRPKARKIISFKPEKPLTEEERAESALKATELLNKLCRRKPEESRRETARKVKDISG